MITATRNAVVMEGPNGWPLGLGNISTRITPVASSPEAAPQPAAASRLRLRRCSSFSSFSSSNLDTESTASFFPDQSVPLGRLIGIRVNGGNKQSGSELEEGEERPPHGGAGPTHRLHSEGICAPQLHHVIARIFRRPNNFHALISQ